MVFRLNAAKDLAQTVWRSLEIALISSEANIRAYSWMRYDSPSLHLFG